MPFTFCHPAIVLPLPWLSSRWFSATGLIVGSLTPDFEYFLRMRMQGDYAHTLPGIVFFCIPVGLLSAFVFHNVVRNKLFENLPRFLRSRLMPITGFDWNQYFRDRWYVVIPSILLGAASHIFWDGFTHTDGYFVKALPALGDSIDVGIIQIELYRVLQHASTVVGGIVIGGTLLSLRQHKVPKRIGAGWKYWTILTVIGLLIITVALMAAPVLPSAVSIVVMAISAILLSLMLTPLVVR